MEINYTPLNDLLLIELSKDETKTAGGIVLSTKEKDAVNIGVVKKAGPGFLQQNGERRAMQVKVGDKVAFGQFAGRSDLPKEAGALNSAFYKVIPESEVLAIIEE